MKEDASPEIFTQHYSLQLEVQWHREFPEPLLDGLLDVMRSGVLTLHPTTANIRRRPLEISFDAKMQE